jgi:hypothetical protein
MGANPKQRLHEDARHLAEVSADLGIGLLQSSLLLGSFIGILWSLSENVTFHVSGHSFVIPGYMVWCALAFAGADSWLTWRTGRQLFQLNAEHDALEAKLRVALVGLKSTSTASRSIRNKNTRIAYYHAIGQFLDWCQRTGFRGLEDIEPITVAAYVEQHLGSPATIKQHMSAIRMLFFLADRERHFGHESWSGSQTEKFSRNEAKRRPSILSRYRRS